MSKTHFEANKNLIWSQSSGFENSDTFSYMSVERALSHPEPRVSLMESLGVLYVKVTRMLSHRQLIILFIHPSICPSIYNIQNSKNLGHISKSIQVKQ